MGVPNDGKRWLIASPEFMEVLMSDSHYIRQGDLSQELVQNGVVGRIAGYNVFESNNTMFEDTEIVSCFDESISVAVFSISAGSEIVP